MSGGHFDYQDYRIQDMMDKIEEDIEYNDKEYIFDEAMREESTEEGYHYGYQHSPQTLDILKRLLKDLKKVKNVLHFYDWYISGDTCEETFIEKASVYYKPKKTKESK